MKRKGLHMEGGKRANSEVKWNGVNSMRKELGNWSINSKTKKRKEIETETDRKACRPLYTISFSFSHLQWPTQHAIQILFSHYNQEIFSIIFQSLQRRRHKCISDVLISQSMFSRRLTTLYQLELKLYFHSFCRQFSKLTRMRLRCSCWLSRHIELQYREE